MTTQYPAKIDDNTTLPVAADNSSLVRATAVTELRAAIIAIESTLGVNPASVYGTIRERLAAFETVLASIEAGVEVITLGGDLSGGSISQTVIGLQGNAVSDDIPSDGYLLAWSDSSESWEPSAPVAVDTAPPLCEISFMSGLFTITNTSYTRAGARLFSMTPYPETIGAFTRTVTFIADMDKTSGATSAEIQLYDTTHSVVVAGTTLTSVSDANSAVTAVLTVGSSSGNLRDDVDTQYELQFRMNGGGGSDAVFLTNARLEITYA